MSKTPSPHFQMESWAIVFSISVLIIFGIVYIWLIYQSLDRRIWFTIFVFHFKKSFTLFQVLIYFVTLWLVLPQLKLSSTELPKYTPIILWKIMTIPFVLFYQFFFYMTQPIKFISELLEVSYSFKIIVFSWGK